MIEALREFYKEWLAWVDAGPRRGHKFFRYDEGLCLNAYGYALNYSHLPAYDFEELLRDQFEAQGLDRHYPFGKRSYQQRWRNGTLHRCPKRIAWVRAQLEDADNATQHEQVYA